MPLCDACHNKVHRIPELDQMARVDGDPMLKRRMVILRLKGQPAQVIERVKIVERVRVVQTPKMSKKERRAQKAARRTEVAPIVLAIITKRFRCDSAQFAGWPVSTLNAIFMGGAIPIFARPELAASIAQTNPGEVMTLTAEDVKALRTEKNAFTRFTLDALGLVWNKLEAGWPTRLVGSTIPRGQYLRALAGKTIYAGAAKSIAI